MLELDSPDQLAEALIRARIAAGLSPKEMAGRLGLKEQQIQRNEAPRYAGASLDRVQAVAGALGMQIHERAVLPTGPRGSAEPGGEDGSDDDHRFASSTGDLIAGRDVGKLPTVGGRLRHWPARFSTLWERYPTRSGGASQRRWQSSDETVRSRMRSC